MGKRTNEEREEGEVEDDSDEEFNDGYDENLMGDEDDKKKLSEMNEKERELELFNRSEKREVLKTRFEIEKKLKRQKLNEKRRSSSGKSKLRNAIKDLKEIREKKKNQQRLRAIDIYSSSSSSSESSSSDDDEDEISKKKVESRKSPSSSSDSEKSDKEEEDVKSDSEEEVQEKEEPVTRIDLNAARVSRHRCEQWIHFPFFNDTLTGAFVKVSTGRSYRIGQVTEVYEGTTTYILGDKRTNKMMKIKFGAENKPFRFVYLSNNEFTSEDFEDWKARCDKDRIEMVTKKSVEKKAAEIQKAHNYQFNESDIEKILEEKKKYQSLPYNFAVKKTELKKLKELAEQQNNIVEVEKLNTELEKLEDQAKQLDQRRTQTISAISYINERNRMRNIVESEKAIIEERKKEKEQGDDPFRRRKCAPILVHKFQKNDAFKEDGIDKKDANKDGEKSGANGETKNETGNGGKIGQLSMNTSVDDLFSAHDFDIQIDFDNAVKQSHLPPPQPPVVKAPTTVSRRSLNLEDYKKKKGLI